MAQEIKVGDKHDKWTVAEVRMVPFYVYKRRIQVDATGDKGYHFHDSNDNQWCILDGEKEPPILFTTEFKYIDE